MFSSYWPAAFALISQNSRWCINSPLNLTLKRTLLVQRRTVVSTNKLQKRCCFIMCKSHWVHCFLQIKRKALLLCQRTCTFYPPLLGYIYNNTDGLSGDFSLKCTWNKLSILVLLRSPVHRGIPSVVLLSQVYIIGFCKGLTSFI